MNRAALMLIDVQVAIDDPKWGRRGQVDAEINMAALLSAWRNAKLPVFHIRHDSKEPRSPYLPGTPGHAFKREVEPLPGEVIVPKCTNSAFIGTGMAEKLASAEINKLVIAGVLLENSVEATVRMAGNLGYDVTVVEDAVASIDRIDRKGTRWTAEQVHALTLSLLEDEYASISDSKTIIGSMS